MWKFNRQTRSYGTAREPFFFESDGRPLYGVYYAPSSERPNAPALVACNSFGLEQAVPARMLGLAARRAAELGYPSIIFHSRGHGDSAGDFADLTLEAMVEDALEAAKQVQARGDASSIIWLGVRFGALIAAAAAQRGMHTTAVALWEPAHSGQVFFRQLLRGLLFAEVARGHRSGATVEQLLERIDQEGKADVHASYLHAKFYRSARAAELTKYLEGWTGPVMVAQIQPRLNLAADHGALVKDLQHRGCGVTVANVRDDPGWQFWRPVWTSDPLLDVTGKWLDELAGNRR